LSPVLKNWTIVDTTTSGQINHSAAPFVALEKGEAHFHVVAQGPLFRHEFVTFYLILDKHRLLEALMYDELIPHQIVLNLDVIFQLSVFPTTVRAELTLSARIQVIRDESGSCWDVSMRFLVPMNMGDCLPLVSRCLHT
jgi:hypothetical protein